MRRRPSKRARALASVLRAVRGEHQGSVSTEDIFDQMSALFVEAGLRPLFKPIGLNLNVSAELPTLESM